MSIGDREIGDFLETKLPGLRGQLETLEAARDRVTVTRLVALGVFALAAPKRDRRRVLALTGPDGFEAALVVDGTDEVHLRQWVAWLNRQGAAASVPDWQPTDHSVSLMNAEATPPPAPQPPGAAAPVGQPVPIDHSQGNPSVNQPPQNARSPRGPVRAAGRTVELGGSGRFGRAGRLTEPR